MVKIRIALLVIAATFSVFAEFGKTPVGWGDMRFGLVNDQGEHHRHSNRRIKTAVQELGINITYRYRYVNNGIDPRRNNIPNIFPWRWNNNYSKHSMDSAGVQAAYVIYVLQEDREPADETLKRNINNPDSAAMFFWTLQIVAENAAGFGSTIIVEPDTWGYVLQRAHDNSGSSIIKEICPSRIPARVNDLQNFTVMDTIADPTRPWDESLWQIREKEINFDHLRDLPNTMSGFGVAIIRTIRKFAPDAYIGFLASHWSVNLNLGGGGNGWNTGLVWSSPALIDTSAKMNIEFFSKLYGFTDPAITLKPGDRADFIGMEKNGWCAGQYEVEKRSMEWYWGDAQMENYLKWVKQVAQGLDLPVVGWQISIGNMDNPNVSGSWKDDFFPYFFQNVDKFIDAGFIGFLVGKGLAFGTDYALPGENDGDRGWFFSQLMEFDKGRPYYTEKDEIGYNGNGGGENPSSIINLRKKSNSINIAAVGKSLHITMEGRNNAVISVFDVSGRRVFQSRVNQNAVIPLNNLTSGVYFVRMESSGINHTSRVLLR